MQRHPPHQSCGRIGSLAIADRLEQEVRSMGINVLIERSGCMSMCRYGPCIRLVPDGKNWLRVSVPDIPGILEYVAANASNPCES